MTIMNEVLEWVKLILLFCPIIVLIVGYFILKKFKMKQQYAFGFSADITTLLLFVAVPFIIHTIWDYQAYIIFIIVAIVIALIFTFKEWRTKKEMKVLLLFRKIWRMYFVSLTAMYVIVILAALIMVLIQNL